MLVGGGGFSVVAGRVFEGVGGVVQGRSVAGKGVFGVGISVGSA